MGCLQNKPDAVFIGLPPEYHGSIDDPKASVELELAEVGLTSFSLTGIRLAVPA